MSNIVHGLKTDSKAYQLVNDAIDLAIEECIGVAKIWLAAKCRELKLKAWEQSAIGRCFVKLVEERL